MKTEEILHKYTEIKTYIRSIDNNIVAVSTLEKILDFQNQCKEPLLSAKLELFLEIKMSEIRIINETRHLHQIRNNNGLIDEEYLIGIHKNLTFDEATSLKKFANSKTISYKECYGDGSMVYPLWKAQK